MRVNKISTLTLTGGLVLALAGGLAAASAPAALSPAASAVAPAPAGVMHLDARPELDAIAARPPATPGQTLFRSAVWPGILWHGAGYSTAGNEDMALGLTGAEGFAVFVSGFSVYTLAAAVGRPDQSIDSTQALAWVGGGMFVAGWAWDMIGSYLEVKHRAPAPNVSLGPLPDGAALAYRF